LNYIFISGFCKIRNFQVITPGDRVKGDETGLDDFLSGMYARLSLSYPKFYKMDAQSKAGFLATECLLKDVDVASYSPDTIAVVLSNATASQDTDIRYQATVDVALLPEQASDQSGRKLDQQRHREGCP